MSSLPTILLIENCHNDLILIQSAFARVGVRNPIRVARHIHEAMAYFAGIGVYADRSEYPLPTLTVLDADFPENAAIKLVEWIKGQPQFEPIPLIVIGSGQTEWVIQQIYNSGANAYLPKLMSLRELALLIKNLDFVARILEPSSS